MWPMGLFLLKFSQVMVCNIVHIICTDVMSKKIFKMNSNWWSSAVIIWVSECWQLTMSKKVVKWKYFKLLIASRWSDTVIYDVKGKRASNTIWYWVIPWFHYIVRSNSRQTTSNHKSGCYSQRSLGLVKCENGVHMV